MLVAFFFRLWINEIALMESGLLCCEYIIFFFLADCCGIILNFSGNTLDMHGY